MANVTPIRTGYDTWVSSDSPTSKHPRDNALMLDSNTSYAYIYFTLGGEIRGNTVLAAPLHNYGRGTGWGSNTVTVRRITEKWDAGTLTWKNKPGVGSTVATRTQTNPDDPTEWVIDIAALIQEVASGARWYGLRLEISDTTARRFNSLNAAGPKPWLEVRWTEAPAAPVDLSPSGGLAVSTSRPVLSWSNEDSAENNTLTAFEVQIDPAANATTPAWTSHTVLGDMSELDLSNTDYPGLAAGATTQWRVRVQNDAGWSNFSDWATFSQVDKGAVTILTPGDTVAEFTPPVSWTTTFTQTAWQLLITDVDDTTDVMFDTGRKSGTSQDFTIPQKDPRTGRRILRDDRDYRLVVRAWDSVDRIGTTGDPAFASSVVIFHYADDPTPNRVTNLGASQVDDSPYVDLTWERDTTPDGWTILANGRVVDTGIAGADLLISGTRYKYRFKDARPGVAYAYQVKPTVNGVTAGSPTVTLTTEKSGLWIMGPDDIDVLVGVNGDDIGSFAMPDRGTTIELPGAVHPTRITQGVNGLRGEVHGALFTWSGKTADQWSDRLLKIKRRFDEEVTIYFGDLVMRARIFDIVVEPTRDGRTIPVSFSFFQTGTPDWLD